MLALCSGEDTLEISASISAITGIISVSTPASAASPVFPQRVSTAIVAVPWDAWSAPAPATLVTTVPAPAPAPAVPIATAPVPSVPTATAAAVTTATAPAVATATAPATAPAPALVWTQASLRDSDAQHLSAHGVQQKQLLLTSVGVLASNQEQDGRGSSLTSDEEQQGGSSKVGCRDEEVAFGD